MMTQNATPILSARNLVVHRDGKRVLNISDIQVEESKTLAIIGSNGAGKSTLMLALVTLLKRTAGELYFRDMLLSKRNTAAFRRKIALVLQDPLLLDATVYKNVAMGLRFRGLPAKEIVPKVTYWLEKLGIAHLKDRSARQLSNGETQRVSLARAFALDPEILLLDEPFRALDARTRSQILEDFQVLLANSTLTTLFVTHDMNEALLLGDRIAVILDGELRQMGTPEEIFNSPVDVEVGSLVGVDTIFSGKIIASNNENLTVDVCGLEIIALGTGFIGQEVLLLLRPEDITLWTEAALPLSSARNCLTGNISRILPQGPLMKVVIECRGQFNPNCLQVTSLITRSAAQDMHLLPGKEVTLTFKASAIHLIKR